MVQGTAWTGKAGWMAFGGVTTALLLGAGWLMGAIPGTGAPSPDYSDPLTWLRLAIVVSGVTSAIFYARWSGSRVASVERDLARKRARLRAVLDSLTDAVAILDEKGGLLVANSAMEKLHDCRDAETLRWLMANAAEELEFSRPDGTPLPAAQWPVNRIRAGEMLSRVLVRFRRRGAAMWRDLEVTGSRIASPPGDSPQYLLLQRDVTEIKAGEERLRHAQRIELVGQLASGMAHDFNNILTVIMAGAEAVEASLPADSPLRGEFEQVIAATERGADLSNRILALTRRQALNQCLLPVSQLASEIAPLARRLVPSSIAFDVRDTTSPSDAISVDEGSMEQVLLNLITNARDAMPEGGRLKLEMDCVAVDESFCAEHPALAPGHHIRISVIDNGTGMDTATAKRAFEPFFTTKDQHRGTGLGLAMVDRLVTAQGGVAVLKTLRGLGTTVEIYLPRKVMTPMRGVASMSDLDYESGATILLAEDDDAVARATCSALESRGHRVLRAADGLSALAIYRHRKGEIDLVISDLQMPGLSGADLITAVRAEDPLIPFVYLTASSMHHGTLARLGGHNVTLLQKPWKRDDLMRSVDRALRAARKAKPALVAL